MFGFVLIFAKIAIPFSICCCLYRVIRGPNLPDRILGLDTMSVHVVALLILLSIEISSTIYLHAALLIALFGFLTAVSISKYILKGKIID